MSCSPLRLPDLVPGDTNGSRDVFVRDTVAGTTTRVSVATDGTQSNGISGDPVISADGRYVSFDSSATNLVAGGTTGQVNVFRHDLDSGETTVVSVGVAGAQSTGYAPSISADGRYISFTSSAGNLVTGDTNAQTDVFVRDLVAAVTTKASVATDATQGDAPSLESSISGDGQLVAFVSTADTFVSGAGTPYGEVFLRNRATGTTTLVSAQPDGHAAPYGAGEPILSGNGQWVADESGSDVVGDGLEVGGDFERNLATGATTRISAASDGSQSSDDQDYRRMSLSADGQRAVFTFPEAAIVPGYGGQNLAVFVHDLATASTDLVSVGNDGVEAPGDPGGRGAVG